MSKKTICITGVSDSRSAREISLITEEKRQCLVIVSGRSRAEKLASDLSFFTNRKITVLPPEEEIVLDYEARSNDSNIARLRALKALRTDHEAIIVAPVSAAVKPIPPHYVYESEAFTVNTGCEIDIEELKQSLVGMGYERRPIVACPGDFAVRGGIIDVFTPDAEDPYRIELFGTDVDSVRSFDNDTQRSIENLKTIEIYPARQVGRNVETLTRAREHIEKSYNAQSWKLAAAGDKYAEAAKRLIMRKNELIGYIDKLDNTALLESYVHYFYDDTEYVWDYMLGGTIVIDDPVRVCEHLDLRQKELQNDLEVMIERGQAVSEDAALITGIAELRRAMCADADTVYLMMPFASANPLTDKIDELISSDGRQMMDFAGHMELVASEIKKELNGGYAVTIAASTEGRACALSDFLISNGFDGTVAVRRGSLSSGMLFPKEKISYISDNDIFSSSKIGRRHRRRSKSRQIDSFADLKPGDIVVHENHGIGKFIGFEQLKVDGETKDYIKIKYAGTDMLYVPVEQMDIVQKYIGSDSGTPKINKLSGDEWKLTKQRAKAAVAEMAGELLELYARRSREKGFAFEADTVWQKEFEDLFPYDETDDQLQSVEEIKGDMEKPVPMDRLLCGDVGYGKTEVAARAVFKCLAQGKQAAFLVPTTILANQHFATLKARFADFPFTVEMMSRFRSDKQIEATINGLINGRVDLVIGTHRLLSNDVKFKDLGLLVIDEEQRFGVAHKEKIKKLKANVDVLTLSATPIPRTLNMSLTGIKDMSLITEPPGERYPVQTYVTEQDDILLREIIQRELDRDGQVFVVYNRVRGIVRVAERIRVLVPDAKVTVGHGQMSEHMLEEVMQKFVDGETNVLIATTIIESGLDIPNANTMIVLDADKCGLSQLYQLKGRVGRSNRIAYCYLMYQKDKVLSEVSEKRLKAIKEFTEFGAGFKIAMRDLEIRGAGNVLGAEQSGHMADIGYELYCKLVDDAVRRAKGEAVPYEPEEITVELNVTANIPAWYIEDETIKLQMYKRIASIQTQEDMEDIIDELMDRFGDLPKETLNLLRISRIRTLSEKLALKRIHEKAGKVVVEFDQRNPLSAYAFMKAGERFGRKVFFHGGANPFVRLSADRQGMLDDTVELLELMLANKDNTLKS